MSTRIPVRPDREQFVVVAEIVDQAVHWNYWSIRVVGESTWPVSDEHGTLGWQMRFHPRAELLRPPVLVERYVYSHGTQLQRIERLE
jgi:hypothetical protein